MPRNATAHEALKNRIVQAIETAKVSQGSIANYCGVSRQAVTSWKRTGQISDENLRRLSIVTGHNLAWLHHGQGHPTQDLHAGESHNTCPRCHGALELEDHQLRRLLSSIESARAGGRLNESSIAALISLIESLGPTK